MAFKVTLTGGEVAMAGFAAGIRAGKVVSKNLNETHGSKREGAHHRHYTGTLGELAFAKHFNRFWSPIDAFNMYDGDVAGMEVRGTEWKPGRELQDQNVLLLHEEDKDERLFVLALVKLPDVYLVGYLERAKDGKRAEWWKDPTDLPGRRAQGRFCYMVEHQYLIPMEKFR